MTTGAQQLPRSRFEASYSQHPAYPTNLVYCSSYRRDLESYKYRLDDAQNRLFLPETTNTQLDVRIRDYDATHHTFEQVAPNSIANIAALRRHLEQLPPPTATRFSKPDPKCRYVSIYSKNSRLPLRISRAMTNLLLSFHQVMPSYLDFMTVFGLRVEEGDNSFTAFHEQSTLAVPLSKRPAVPQLGRSGHGYQLCYNLKTVVEKDGDSIDRWSVRQAALHHQFDVDEGKALWICTEGRGEGLFDRIRDITSDVSRQEDWSYATTAQSFKSSLATHLACCSWSMEGWRTYISWLKESIGKVTEETINGSRKETKGVERKIFTLGDLQHVQAYEDKVNEVILILDTNNENLQALSRFYTNLMNNDNLDPVVRQECAEDVREFATLLANMVTNARTQIRTARLLAKNTADRKALILQLLQGQATEATLKLTYMSYKEAIVMRIITIVTLIFLPATFVSTFFSTDIVKYQDQDGDGSFSNQAMFRWLQVTMPLSALTLGIGYACYRYLTRESEKQKMLPS